MAPALKEGRGVKAVAPDEDMTALTIRELVLADLVIDHRYQRDEARIVPKARTYARDFDEVMAGPLLVGEWKGTYSVIDGQTRRYALMLLGVESWPCAVKYDIPPERQAEYFARLPRERSTVTPLQEHKAAVFACDHEALTLERVVTATGFSISGGSRHRGISAIVALRRALQMNGEVALTKALRSIGQAWGMDDRNSKQAHMIEGLALVYGRYSNAVNEERMIRKLAERPSSIVHQMVVARSQGLSTSRQYVAARTMIDIYNKGRHTTTHTLDPDMLTLKRP